MDEWWSGWVFSSCNPKQPPNQRNQPNHRRYEAAVAALERACLAEPGLPTSHLHHALAQGGWTVTLPLLAQLVGRVERRGLRYVG